ncbi:hypothetical protein V5N11_013488 [Cardamine amara subsp. amara]|uniref:DEK-C domain-containing protein n=1 Tax=Cardamine amara subsp. amara TaxID=228776 RepID=A0ABD0ZAW2_CARAN
MSGESTTTSMESAVADKIVSKDTEATTDIESQILTAMRNRVTYLRNKADSFTIESVRRLLEEDMELEIYDLDVHKSFIKQNLVQCLESAGDNDESSENFQKTEKRVDVTPVNVAKLSKGDKAKKDAKEDTTCDDDDERMEDSPVMGLLTEENTSKSVAEGTKDEDSKEFLQSEIKRALLKRRSYIKANAEKVTLGVLRRLLEQDLKLEKYSLDPYKKYINEELDEVLQDPKPSPKTQSKTLTKKAKSKTSKNSDSEESSDSDGEEDEEFAVKKKTAQKRKSPMSEGTGKRKRENEKVASVKKTKQTDSQSDSDAGDNPSSSEKSVKKQETATTVYGKRVEHLKSVIKSCGMSIAPSVYRKAKQAPEEKREDTLIKELKEILSKEGLSSNPSENEIKEVKKRKERSKELEGIDTSNIVSSIRRRSNTSFVPPPKPEKTEESESDESEDSENEEDEEEEAVVEEEEDEGNEDGGEGSQSEEEPNTEDGDEDERE